MAIKYDSKDKQNAPETVVLKMPRSDAKRSTRFYYLCESKFYEKIGPLICGMKLPSIYFSYFNNQSENAILLMEDLGSAKFYSFQGTPGEDRIPLDKVLAAARSLAILHAQFFLDSNLLEPANVRFNWLRKFGDPTYLQEIVEKWKYYWSFAKQRLEHKVRHDFYSILSDPIKIKTLITDLAKNAPMTLVHTDVWINNFCFVNDQFCALDWQTVMIGPGVIDLVKKK